VDHLHVREGLQRRRRPWCANICATRRRYLE
jgi:hypothetical protein